ncbi:hypothetical protein BDQ12DRAFT_729228 [Crucibulum laeve]|uniref:Uncharacterized protein n=1 Tax=Crucibulum laeve TaxID=68775 RepID=A0A5C3LF77_9AGAR|nr:hypothetical protein BDQ12DRAFT_729228 [Crucibulum laeve]
MLVPEAIFVLYFIMRVIQYLVTLAFGASYASAWVYPQCQYNSECHTGEICCYHRGTGGVPPALCLTQVKCDAT